MDEEYDFLVCGTGFVECILSGLLSVSGKKVLHVDRNDYYGGNTASLNLTQLFEHFKEGKPPASFGNARKWNVDLIPKFVMSDGMLVQILLATGVHQYLEWQVVQGTYVFQHQEKGFFSKEKNLHKVPSSEKEAITSPLLAMLEKTRFISFLRFVVRWDKKNSSTWDGMDPRSTTMKHVFEYFNLGEKTQDFIGHAVALYTNDDYKRLSYEPTVLACQLYWNSISKTSLSPFLYPLYGLGDIPQSFSRLSAVFAGTFMLSKPVDEFLFKNGKVCGMRSGEETVKVKNVICDPSYVMRMKGKTKHGPDVIRAICLLSHSIPETNNANSCQIIMSAKELNRKSDVFIMLVSSAQNVASEGKYIAICSTTIETDEPKNELAPAFTIIGACDKVFYEISKTYQPVETTDGIYVSSSYDATSHFETATQDVLRIWKDIFGKELDLEKINKTREELIAKAQHQ